MKRLSLWCLILIQADLIAWQAIAPHIDRRTAAAAAASLQPSPLFLQLVADGHPRATEQKLVTAASRIEHQEAVSLADCTLARGL